MVDVSKIVRFKFFASPVENVTGQFMDRDGELLSEFEGDCPNFLGEDTLEMEINLKTGQIVNWVPPTDAELLELVSEQAAEEAEGEESEVASGPTPLPPPCTPGAIPFTVKERMTTLSPKARTLAESLEKQIAARKK